jgi:hypothetical protein
LDSTVKREDAIAKARLTLLRGKTWRYLRYLHFRDAVSRVANDVDSICVCGAGHGYSELAVAAEYPDIEFTLTDIVDTEHGYPNYHATMDMAWKWGIENLKFSVWNVLEPTHRRFDLVASTEMLEHIKDFRTAAANMRQAARKFVYCLVPYADKATNANPAKRNEAWEKHKHHVFGYDAEELSELFPSPMMLAGAYWNGSGGKLREYLSDLDDEAIRRSVSELEQLAATDLVSAIPTSLEDAIGIKILSRVSA